VGPYERKAKKFNKENFQAMRFVLLFARISKVSKPELD
jgi:stalled ribosome alternative rescue factor ArfA